MLQETRREKWETIADWPLTAAAVLFLAAYAWPILEPDLSTPLFAFCRSISLATWLIFAIDYFARLGLSYDKDTRAPTSPLSATPSGGPPKP